MPDLALPEEKAFYTIGVYGERHRRFLINHRKMVYQEILVSGRLHSYLSNIDDRANEMFELLVK